jgi:predicted Zn-dependent peptidase
LAIVGAISKDEVLPKIKSVLGNLPKSTDNKFMIEKPELNESKKVENHKANLNQAHIVKGWLVPTTNEADYPALNLLNVILGSSGLSSRLFLELRDKKGLAYVVRSSYETFKLVGNFMIYIATEPNNIDTCLKGFDEEINKIRTIPVSEAELNDAKNNIIGKCAFFEETNIQQASSLSKYGVLGYGFNFSEEMKEKVKAVTSEEILACAQKYFNENYVISITRP